MSLVVERPEAVSGLEWTVLRGSREEVMRGLGHEHADAIAAWRDQEDGGWRAHVRRAEGAARDRFEAVLAATRRRLPLESQELAWIAEGAGVPERELWACNLRGDLGRDGTGCSDLAVRTEDGVAMGHNEDGDGELRDAIRLVTLDIDGDPSVTVVWYPGMLPSNSFVTTSVGLSFGMDHVPVVSAETDGAGRHFVARHAQRQADGRAARSALAEVPCAGGFAFDVADAQGRVDLIENAAGLVAVDASGSVRHTNHLRLVDGTRPGLAVSDDDPWLAESRGRIAALATACPRPTGADDILRGLRAPGVLNRTDDLWTFATTVVDTAADRILVQGAGEVWAGRLGAFARGERVDA